MQEHLAFGQWLKRRRQGLGLTQRALGQQAGYSDETIRKVEAGAVRPSRQMAERLAGTLRLEAAEWPRFVAFARAELDDEYPITTQTVEFDPHPALPDPAEPAAAPDPRHNLPGALTRFFGRENEIAQLNALLAEYRLVTVTGPAGVGKTRLALVVAEAAAGEASVSPSAIAPSAVAPSAVGEAAIAPPALPLAAPNRYADGVWLVELASVADPQRVPHAVALALGVRKSPGRTLLETLSHFLHSRQRLLLLDNCEHVLDACARLADDLLRACPRLTLLATSRQPLGVSGEAVYSVPALPVPGPSQSHTPEALAAFPAVRLFADRARMVHPTYQITPANAAWVARVCQRLDGLPLAIEMAAARMNLLSVEQLAGRLDDAFGVLTNGSRAAAPRQQTMRATLDWSYQLLSEPERLLLRRLAVFAGGCTLQAAEAVCAGDELADGDAISAARVETQPGERPGAVVGLLAALVAKSMVIVDRRPGEETRYRLLEVVRQYALSAPPAVADDQPLAQRHFDYFLRFAESNGPQLWYKNRRAWLAKFEAEHSNLLAALAWGYTHAPDPAAGPRLTVALHPFWYGHALAEAQECFQMARARCQAAPEIAPSLQALVFTRGSSHLVGYAPRAAVELAQQGLALSRTLRPEQPEIIIQALMHFIENACDRYVAQDDPALLSETQAAMDELRARVGQLGPHTSWDPRVYRARAAAVQAVFDYARGAYAPARAAALESVRRYSEVCHEDRLVGLYQILGNIALATAATGPAREYYLRALRLAVQCDHVFHGDILAALCAVALRLNDPAQALNFCQAYIKLAYAKDTPFNVADRLEMMAKIFAGQGRALAAARFSGAAEALSEKVGRTVSAAAAPDANRGDWTTRYADASLEALVPDWQARPDGGAIQQAWHAGRALSYDALVAEALAAEL